MRKKQFFSLLLIISAIMFLPVNLSSRVAIGIAEPPHDFSVLELISNETMGFRLPQMDSLSRNEMQATPEFQAEREGLALGLTIFNTDTRCVETWNGTLWIQKCESDPCYGLGEMDTDFCLPFIIDHLTARAEEAGGTGTIQWFSTATGDTPIAAGTSFEEGTHTFWADNCAGQAARIPVTVEVVDCTPIYPDDIFITTFVNVMYDFQHQDLMSFVADDAGEPAKWQWQVSTAREGTFIDIPYTNYHTLNVPADLIHNPDWVGLASFDGINELFFRVKMKTQASDEWSEMPNTNALGIRFIRTTVGGEGTDFLPGYGKDETAGVRWATMSRAPHGGTGTGNPTTIRVALLNLGATDYDGVGLGDFFQWGRIDDGHQTIVWGKPTVGNIRNNIFVDGTSENIPRDPDMINNVDPHSGQATGNFVGNFITTAGGDWGDTTGAPGRNDLWGNDLPVDRANSPLSIAGWTPRAQENNPCAVLGAGWRVPSAAEWGDMHSGDGTGVGALSPNDAGSSGVHNRWIWRDMQANTGAVGGRILSNQNLSDVYLFLPAVGWRTFVGGVGSQGLGGNYWSSTFSSATPFVSSVALGFNSNGINAGQSSSNRSFGMSVRCVSDIPDPCAGLGEMDTFFCTPFNINHLTARAREASGTGDIQWFSTATGGTPIVAGTAFGVGNHTFWADNCTGTAARIQVTVQVENCTAIAATSINVTAFVNVLYDFQTQRLEAWSTGTAPITAVRWEVRVADTNVWFDVPGANTAVFTLPADFIHSRPEFAGQNYLEFRAVMGNPNSPNVAQNARFLNIRFIRTTNAGEGTGFRPGFGRDANGVRWVTVNRARSTATGQNATNATTIRVALLNLGATDTDGVGLGDFYQWGRVADGHQRIVWGKPTTGNIRNNIFVAGTSESVIRNRPGMSFDAQGQVTNLPWRGSFISQAGSPRPDGEDLDWGNQTIPPTNRADLWGNGSDFSGANSAAWRNSSPASINQWTQRGRNNNPCAVLGASWRVPSAAEWSDMHAGDGTIIGSRTEGHVSTANNNTWAWRDMNSGAAGGMIITNNLTPGATFFLPSVSFRTNDGGLVLRHGIDGAYWSTSNMIHLDAAQYLRWTNMDSSIPSIRVLTAGGLGSVRRSLGASVRCVW